MKRMVSILLVLAGLLVTGVLPGSMSASANGAPSVFLDGVVLDQEDTMIVEGRTLIRLRALTDPEWLVFAYDPQTKEVMFHTQDDSIYVYLREGDKTATVNDKQVQIDTPVMNKDGFTYVPLRFISETLGAYVHYFAEDNRVIVRTPKAQVKYETLMHGDLTDARKIAINLPRRGTGPQLEFGEMYSSNTYTFPEGEALRFIYDASGYSQHYYEVNEQGFAVLKWQYDAVADKEWGTKPAFERAVYFDDLYKSQVFYYGTLDEQGNRVPLGEFYYDNRNRVSVMPIEGEVRTDAKP